LCHRPCLSKQTRQKQTLEKQKANEERVIVHSNTDAQPNTVVIPAKYTMTAMPTMRSSNGRNDSANRTDWIRTSREQR
jgi:hypothetical protein